MPQTLGPGARKRSDSAAPALDRRGFLTRLALLAGAGSLVPLVRGRGIAAGTAHRLEAGRPALGTWLRVVVRHPDHAVARAAIEDAFAAVRTVDAQMSVHRADSQLSHVNAEAGRAATRVDLALLDVVSMACAASVRSGGIYDPTVLPLMRLYGFYGSGVTAVPRAREVDAVLARMGAGEVEVDRATQQLALRREHAGLDLGSIGKGWAVDRAVQALRARGVRSGLVDLGGNVYGLGTPDDDAPGWSVGVFHPVTGELSKVFVLHDTAVATSGNSEQSHLLGRVRIGHLFDAGTGLPADGHLSSSVVARTGVESDICSTVSFLLGPDRFRGWPGVLDSHFIG
jgi:thiamine biosynthesis lipoprotein